MISLSVDELSKIIADTVKACLADWQPPQSKPQPDEYVTRARVCELLHISLPTVHAWMKQGKLKAYHIGGRTLFRESEIMTAAKPVSYDIPRTRTRRESTPQTFKI